MVSLVVIKAMVKGGENSLFASCLFTSLPKQKSSLWSLIPPETDNSWRDFHGDSSGHWGRATGKK